MTLDTISSARSFGGTQLACRHASRETGTDMTFGIYLPPQAEAGAPLPILWYLSGLILVAPDTSPRGPDVPDEPDYDFGQGAGFYVDATQEPFAANYRMESYVAAELPDVVAANFPADMTRQAITGHSMGGHGALTLALKHPGRYRSVSAFAPIAAPSQVPWGEKALGRYLGPDRAAWRDHDALALIEDGACLSELLVDQGEADSFLDRELKPELLAAACRDAGIPLTLRMQPGYDHSYFFISTFMEDHLRWHWARLTEEPSPRA
jgi:S-formylglutathione hydrolase